MRPTLTFVILSLFAATASAGVVVDCDGGQSLGRALMVLPRSHPVTVTVRGTCSEFVSIVGFEGLTVKGAPGAVLRQPGPPATPLVTGVLTIASSRSVTISGFRIEAETDDHHVAGIQIRSASTDVRLRNLDIDGGDFGVIAFEGSQVSLARVRARDPGFATVGIYDLSNAFVEDCLLESTTGRRWNEGIEAVKAFVSVHGTTIRNMNVGIAVRAAGILETANFATYYPADAGPSEVVIDNPAGRNFAGVSVSDGGTVNLATTLRILDPGQWWGGETGGVVVTDGSAFNAGANLEVVGSRGQGVFVANNSSANLAGSTITSSQHAGLVVVNHATVSLAGSGSPTTITGTGSTDLFCDSRSLITGAANAPASRRQCVNLLEERFEPLP